MLAVTTAARLYGIVAELTGLKTGMSFNGQSAEVFSVDRTRSRYEIWLGDGAIKTIRAENLKAPSNKVVRAALQHLNLCGTARL